MRLLEKDVFLVPDFFLDLSVHAFRLFELVLSALVSRLQIILLQLLNRESRLRVLILFLGSFQALHLLLKDLVDVRDRTSLVLKLSSEGRKLILQDGDLTLRGANISLLTLQSLPDLDQLTFFSLDLALSLFVGLLFSLETAQVLLVLVLFALQPALGITVLHSSLVDEFISSTGVLDGVLPLEVELVALLMEAFKFFRGLVELNLSGLRLRNLHL